MIVTFPVGFYQTGFEDTYPVGSVIQSLLDETTFQDKRNNKWVLCDGQDVTGSDYDTLTGNSTVPDLRGRFMRMKDHGVGKDSAGDRAIGNFQDQDIKSHTHSYTQTYHTNNDRDAGANTKTEQYQTTLNTGYQGSESRPKNICVNFFIKVND